MMDRKMRTRVIKAMREQRRKKIWHRVFYVLAAVVVFCTTYALILPAITMENTAVLDCPLTVHTHEADCYDTEGNLICGQADFVVHTHNETCYDGEGRLVCVLPEIEAHEHTDECYEEKEILICNSEESEEHQHEDSCYTVERGDLICGKEEIILHQHTEDCYDEEGTLICGKLEIREHVHDEECFRMENMPVEEETTEAEESASGEEATEAEEPAIGEETTEEEESASGEEITGAEEPAVGEETTEEEESASGEETTEAEEPASGEEITGTEEPAPDEEAYLYEDDRISVEVILTPDPMAPEKAERETESITEEEDGTVSGETEPIASEGTELENILSGSMLSVDALSVNMLSEREMDSSVIADDAETGEAAPAGAAFGEAVSAGEESGETASAGVLPEGTVLRVTPITAGDEAYDYDMLVWQAEEAAARWAAGIVLYDISFYTPEGEYIPVADTATVSLRFKEAVLPDAEDEVTVLHYQDEGELPVVVENAEIERDENGAVTGLTFQTEGFSTFAVMAVEDSEPAAQDTAQGNSFTLTYNGYTITFSVVNSAGNAIPGDYSNITADGTGKYVFSDIAPSIANYTFSRASMSNVEKNLSYVYAGHDAEQNAALTAFRVYDIDNGYYTRDANFSITLTYTKNYDLDGKSYAIVNQASGSYALMTDSATVNGVGGLTSKNVTVTQDENGVYQIVGTEQVVGSVTIWKFAKQPDGTYYISTEVNGATQYLYMNLTPYNDSNDGRGSLTLSDTQQAITVTELGDGRVTLVSGSSNVNRDTESGYFWSHNDAGVDSSKHILCEVVVVPPKDYSGTYAIVNRKGDNTTGVAMMAEEVSGKASNRAGQTVSLVSADGTYYVTDNSVTLWTFEKQNDGSYHIFTAVDNDSNDKKYLTIESSSITLSDTPQSITVTEGAGTYAGMVRLTNANGMAVNLYGSEASQGFGSYNDKGANEWQTLCQVPEGGNYLLYNLNVSATNVGSHIIKSNDGAGSSWEETPTITAADGQAASPIQTFDDDTTVNLYGPGTPGEDEYFTFAEKTREAIRQQLGNAGKEFRFDGWTAVGTDSVTYLFDENAAVTVKETGIHITPKEKMVVTTNGDETISSWVAYTGTEPVTLAPGTTLTAKWTQVSDVVLFFVNYTGTILDTEGDVTGRNQKDFTGIVGIGRVYYGKEQAGRDGVFGNDANEQIRIKFTNSFDPDDPETQVVMEYVTVYDKSVDENDVAGDPQSSGKGYSLYYPASGINDTELESCLLRFIQENNNVTIKVSTTDNANNPEIENENSTVDNYTVRWYVMKEQPDAWHIDGVMVAKTAEVTVSKTFSGLTDDQVKGLLNEGLDSGYRIPVKLGGNRQDYITMTTQSISGQYTYYGQEGDANTNTDTGTDTDDETDTDAGAGANTDTDTGANSNTGTNIESNADTGGNNAEQSYTWILNAITNEQYTLSEEKYTLEGYDVSAIVVHYYTDQDGQTQISYKSAATTEGLNPEVIGGKTTAVSFNNFYTKTGTGAFAIHKSSDNRSGENDIGAALQGAEFTLYRDEACTTEVSTSTTNSRGSAYFNNLDVGTYYMKETQAPQGFVSNSDAVWKVVVSNTGTNNSPKIKVIVYQYKGKNGDQIKDGNGNLLTDEAGTVCYDGEIKASYEIQNTPEAGTVRVTKTFVGLTAAQMENLVQASDASLSGYYIWLSGNVATGGIIDTDESNTDVKLYLQNAARGQDGYTFTWTITNLAMEQEILNSAGKKETKPIKYTISEHHYLTGDYIDTIVTAVVNGETQTENKQIERGNNKSGTVAYVRNVEFDPQVSDTVELTNTYTNTFTLSLQKLDSVTGNPLQNAVFDIYGRYRDATDTSKHISYTDQETGVTTIYYYIQSIISNSKGIATGYNLNLSDGENTFIYIMNESTAPEGYVSTAPQVITVDVTSPDYADGVYSISVPNTKEEDYVHKALDTKKVWDPAAPEEATVTLELYRVTHDVRNKPLANVVDAEKVAEITLDGVADGKPGTSGDSEGDDSTEPETGDSSGDEASAISSDDLSDSRVSGTENVDMTVTVYESAPWVATWGNLYSASKDYGIDGSLEHYHYFVREITAIDGYVTSYTCYDVNGNEPDGAFQKLKVRIEDETGTTGGTDGIGEVDGTDGTYEIIQAVLVADMDEAYTVTITNTERFKLPETGGKGTLPYTIGGTLVIAGSFMYGYKLRRKKERRSAQ